MPPYTPGLSWPRSDGDESSYPSSDEQRPSNTYNWFEKVPLSHEKYGLYENKVGAHIAKLKGIAAASYRMALPPGYALFAHHKPNSTSGAERIDVYLRGCPSIGKKQFRSPNEFLPHAEWLMDTSRPLDDHSTCECIYNNSSDAAAAKKARGSLAAGGPVSVTPKRPRESKASEAGPSSAGPSSKKRKESPSEKEKSEEPQPSAIVPERAIDMATGRRYRKGELIWFRIETIHPPADNGKGLPDLTHWPGLIANATEKRALENTSGIPDSLNGVLNAITGGKAASTATPVTKKRPVVIFEYSIRPLGFFASNGEVAKRPEEVLPWQMGMALLGGNKGWDALGKEGTRVMRERVKADLNELKGKGLPVPTDSAEIDARWREKMAPRYAFNDMPKNWDTVAFRLGIAIKIGSATANSWAQTDKIDLVPGVEVNEEDKEAIESQRKTLFQGLWWGGERIWLEDMVRVRRHRVELPDLLGLPTSGAADRSVTFRIRMITLEISPDATEDFFAYRCHLYGDLYEIAANTDGIEQNLNKGDSDWVLANPKAPPGFYYKQLNEEGSEIMLDIMDVSGRIYPDLLEPTAQNWLAHASLPDEVNKLRAKPDDTAKTLAGLLPSTTVASRSDLWKQDLYTIVSESTKKTEVDFKKFYKSLLGPPLSAPKKKAPTPTAPDTGAPPTPVSADVPAATAEPAQTGGPASTEATEAPAAANGSDESSATAPAAPAPSASAVGSVSA